MVAEWGRHTVPALEFLNYNDVAAQLAVRFRQESSAVWSEADEQSL